MHNCCLEQSGPTHETFYSSPNLYESFMMYTYVELSNFNSEMLFIIRISVQWRLEVFRNII